MSPEREVSATAGTARPGLGVGSILGRTFAIFFRRMPVFILLAFLPLLALSALSGLVLETLTGQLQAAMASGAAGGATSWSLFAVIGLGWLFNALTMTVAVGFMVLAAYDARNGRPVRLGTYLTIGLRRLAALFLCSLVLVLGLGAVFGLLIVPAQFLIPQSSLSGAARFALIALLSVPGYWLAVILSVTVPAVMVEGVGFAAFRRSATLTSGYRWPVFGCLAVLGVCSILITLAVQAGSVWLLLWALPKLFGPQAFFMAIGFVSGVIWQSVQFAVGFGLLYVGIALIYARLREIKEGVGVENLSEVFA